MIYSKNNNICEGETIQLFRYFGMQYQNEMIRFHGDNYMNILYPDNQYLVFLVESAINDYSDIPMYYFTEFMFPAVNLDRSHAGEMCPSFDFNQCCDILYFSSSESIAEMSEQIENRLIELYR